MIYVFLLFGQVGHAAAPRRTILVILLSLGVFTLKSFANSLLLYIVVGDVLNKRRDVAKMKCSSVS